MFDRSKALILITLQLLLAVLVSFGSVDLVDRHVTVSGAVARAEGAFTRSQPEAARRWRSNVSREQYETLLRQKVSEIPELEPLWSRVGSAQKGSAEVYFGGGALRGLMQWLEGQLQVHSYADLLKLTPPHFDSLIQEGADRDLMVLTHKAMKIVDETYQHEWDVLDRGFLEASRAAGGSNIEKFAVRPQKIFDPFDAIGSYLAGRLEFTDVPENQFAQFRGSHEQLNGNSKTALVLRHLRFLVMFDAVSITDADIVRLRAIVDQDVKVAPIEANNYWIGKALKKFITECTRTGVDYEALLEKLGLLETLARLSYATPTGNLSEIFARRRKVIADKMAAATGKELVDTAYDLLNSSKKQEWGYFAKLIGDHPELESLKEVYWFILQKVDEETRTEIASSLLYGTEVSEVKLKMAFRMMAMEDQATLKGFAQSAFIRNKIQNRDFWEAFLLLAKQEALGEMALQAFREGDLEFKRPYLRKVIETGDQKVLKALLVYSFGETRADQLKQELVAIAKRAEEETSKYLAKEFFSKPHSASHVRALDVLVRKNDSEIWNTLRIYAFSKSHAVAFKEQIRYVIEHGSADTLRQIKESVFTKGMFSDNSKVIALSETDPEWRSMRQAVDVADPAARRILLYGETPAQPRRRGGPINSCRAVFLTGT